MSRSLTLRPRKMFPEHYWVFPILRHFLFLLEARNIVILFYTEFRWKQAVFFVFYYFAAAQQTSTVKLLAFFQRF